MNNQLKEVSNPINIQADLEENSMVDGIEKRSKEQGFYATQTIPIDQVNQNITYSYLATLDSHLKKDEHCVHESNIHEVNIDLDKVDVVFKIKELENPAQNGQNQKMVHCLRGLGTGMTSFFLVQITLMSQYLYSCVIGCLMFTTQKVHTVVSQAVG